MEFTAVIEKDEDMFVARCSEVGTVSQGKTVEEAIENLREATELYLEDFPVGNKASRPILTFFEVKNVRAKENIR